MHIRSRRKLIVALLIALVTVFAAGAAMHHLADHGDTTSAASHHSDGDHTDAICAAGAAACGIALLLMGLIGLGFSRIPAPPVPRRRHRQRARGGLSPGRIVFWPLRLADLQCFLT
ncbi:MAG: hypothetical protein QOE98_3027 [Gaiellaceae bacterium]|nr:hypothetical protein [Gaiellaceae bacterium]